MAGTRAGEVCAAISQLGTALWRCVGVRCGMERAAVGWRMHDRGGAVGSFHISAHASGLEQLHVT